MVRFLRCARATLLAAAAFLTFVSAPRPAVADASLSVVSGSPPGGFGEILHYVAERAGFFKDEHLAVTFQYAGIASVAAQLVASGKADICSLAIEPIIQGYERGLRLQAFFSRDPVYDYALGVLDDSPIKTLADFKGTTIGEISVGSPAEISTNSMLEGAGLKKSDVSYIVIGSGAQAVSALTSGKVAAAAFPYPELALYEVTAHVKFRFFRHPILKDIGNTAYAATPATIQNKADLLRGFARAQVKAALLIRENPQLGARYFLEGAGIKVTDEALQNEINVLGFSQDQLPAADPGSKTIGAMNLLGLQFYAKFMNENGLMNSVVPAAAIATNEFIPYANAFDRAAFIAQVRKMH
jgi:NitT/TauT family transport system substrate-binding protein